MRLFRIVLLASVVMLAAPSFSEAGFADVSGEALSAAVPATALLMTVLKKDKEGSVQFLESYAAASAAALGLKYTINERRPNGKDRSFPSFHATSAFAGASFIQFRYGWTYGIPAYIAASAAGAARIASKDHWVQDVLAGAALGIASNALIIKPYKSLTVAPVAENGRIGLIAVKSF